MILGFTYVVSVIFPPYTVFLILKFFCRVIFQDQENIQIWNPPFTLFHLPFFSSFFPSSLPHFFPYFISFRFFFLTFFLCSFVFVSSFLPSHIGLVLCFNTFLQWILICYCHYLFWCLICPYSSAFSVSMTHHYLSIFLIILGYKAIFYCHLVLLLPHPYNWLLFQLVHFLYSGTWKLKFACYVGS